MKKVLAKGVDFLLTVFDVLFAGLMLIVILLYIPMDYILYKFSRFGREVRERYTVGKGATETVRLYGCFRRAGLPISYADGHFLYGNTMILPDIRNIFYREETGEWIIDEEEESQETTLAAFAEEQLAQDPNCERAVFLIDRGTFSDHKDLSKAEQSESILLYEGNGKTGAPRILRAWIDAGAGE